MTNLIDDRVAALRPTDDDLVHRFPIARRQAVLADICDRPVLSLRFRPTRWAVGSAVAALSAVGVVLAGLLLPSGAPGGPDKAAAAALKRLAVIASARDDAVGPHQFAYVSTVSEQRLTSGEILRPGARRADAFQQWRDEEWTSPRGDAWVYLNPGAPGACVAHRAAYSPPPAVNDYQQRSASFLDSLPTTPAGLQAYIDAHPSGDNHGSRNAFIAVGDLLRSGLASPQLRAAAFSVLAEADGLHVDVHARDALGRATIRIDQSGEALFFDPRTSRVLDEQTMSNGSLIFRAIVTRSATVDSVPQELPRC